jgi:hypothetical protein
MAAATGFSHTTIRRIWSAFGLQPHRSEISKLSSDLLFVDKVRDIVGLYLSRPIEHWSLAWMRRVRFRRSIVNSRFLSMMPGVPEHRTASYIRHGRLRGLPRLMSPPVL